MQPIDYNDPNQTTEFELFLETLNPVAGIIYAENKLKGFYDDWDQITVSLNPQQKEMFERIYLGNKLMLMVGEQSECHEAIHKDLDKSEHIPEFSALEEEIADTLIRLLDFAGRNMLRLSEATKAKLIFNRNRPHMHGKKF